MAGLAKDIHLLLHIRFLLWGIKRRSGRTPGTEPSLVIAVRVIHVHLGGHFKLGGEREVAIFLGVK